MYMLAVCVQIFLRPNELKLQHMMHGVMTCDHHVDCLEPSPHCQPPGSWQGQVGDISKCSGRCQQLTCGGEMSIESVL